MRDLAHDTRLPHATDARWNHGFILRIIARGMQGWTAFAISRLVGCSEHYASRILALYRADGTIPSREPQA